MGINGTYNMMLATTMQKIIPTLNDSQRDILRENGYYDLTENAQHVAHCAMLLAIDYVKQATTYAESCGGGMSNLSGWGRNKDEDDVQWWVRCIATAAAMVKPSSRKKTKGVGR